MSGKTRAKKNAPKNVKLPEGASNLKKYSETMKTDAVDEKVIQFVNNLADSQWEPYCARPKSDLFGFYMVCRWFAKERSWVVLYVGRGHVRASLEHHFSGQERTPIGNYLSSFPKLSRSQLWLKWAKDPYYPYEGMNMDDILKVITEQYTSTSECPPFNMKLKIESDTKNVDKLPDDFSIIPDWKPAKSRKAAAKSKSW